MYITQLYVVHSIYHNTLCFLGTEYMYKDTLMIIGCFLSHVLANEPGFSLHIPHSFQEHSKHSLWKKRNAFIWMVSFEYSR